MFSKLLDKSVDNNKALPIRYPWAFDYYKAGTANNWTPEEIPMQEDIELWKSNRLTEDERKIIKYNLGFFSTAEGLTGNNIISVLARHVTDSTCFMYFSRQLLEEVIHINSFIYCIDSLNMNSDEVYDMYNSISCIKKKDDLVRDMTNSILDPLFEINSIENFRLFIKNLICYYAIMEGIYFYAGFAMMLSLKRQRKMVGIGEQFDYILRDESLHLAFGCDLINELIKDCPEVYSEEFKKEIIELVLKAVELEKEYVYEICPNGVLGINADTFCKYVEYIADRRLSRLNLDNQFNVDNPFPWMTLQDLSKNKNFFETKVTEYKTGGLDWD